ncbi:MAG: GNAT family N-acetyltransferase [Demequina sp.]
MTEGIELRPFAPADVPALTQLVHRAYAELGAQGLNFTAVDQTEATTLYRATAGASWVMVHGGRLVATVSVAVPASEMLRGMTDEASVAGRAWLNQLAVDPDYRGQGLARRLRDAAYEWCVSHGATSIGIDTAEPARHLVALYSAWGFEPVDHVQWAGKTYRSVVMTRSLDPATTADALADFWHGCRAQLPHLPRDVPAAWAFGATPAHADGLLALVLDGIKTGTATSLWDIEGGGEPIPYEGELSIILDGAGEPRALIETTDIRIVPFNEVDAEHASAEGEGDRTLAHWRAVHERYWREHSENPRGFEPDMPVVCERFRLLYSRRSNSIGS